MATEEEKNTNLSTDEQILKDEDKKEEKVAEVANILLQYQEKKAHTPKEKVANQSAWEHLTQQELPPKKERFNEFPTYFYAGFWMRLWAYMFDVICIFFISGIVVKLINMVFHLNTPGELVLKTIIYLSYFILLTKLNQGQTLGKAAFGLRVVCFNEAELSWATVLVREGAMRFISQLSMFALTYLLNAFTG